MLRPEVADAAAAALFEALDVMIASVPGGHRHNGEAARRLVTGAAFSTLNGVFATSTAVDVDEVARLAEPLAGGDLPWCVCVRGEPTPELVALATALGRTRRHETPLLVRPAAELAVRSGGPAVRQVTGAESQPYLEALAAGFEAPPSAFGNLMAPAVLNAAGVRAYLVEDGGQAVATGLGVLAGGMVGVFNITTRPQARRRGYGRAITEAVVRDGLVAGASSAYLQASTMGQPLYESMGFSVVESWTSFLPA